jgi:hypothetical protein
MVMGLTEYLHIGGYKIPSAMPFVASIFLVAYGVRKEMDRWLQMAYQKRRGEYFFWMWSIFLFVLFVGQWISHEKYVVPSKCIEAMMYAGIVYIGTGVSRILSIWKLQTQKAVERRRPKSNPEGGGG